jgi:energy-coupling factor transport system permease protein
MSERVLLRPVPVESPAHRVRAEAKIIALVVLSLGLAFHPEWWLIGPAAVATVLAFAVSRLPRKILPRPPKILLFFIAVTLLSAGIGGDPPRVLGISLQALADMARLIVVGILLVLWAGLLAWTTGLAQVGAGMIRIVRPLRRLGLPAEEIGTAIALTVRMIPLVLDEAHTTFRAWRTRPEPLREKERFLLDSIGLAIDIGATVVTNSYRRAIELSQAMVARDAIRAPAPAKLPVRVSDVGLVVVAFLITTALFIWG